MPLTYYNKNHFEAMDRAREFNRLFPIAQTILEKLDRPTIQVCGPISTGKHDIATNIRVFEGTIKKLLKEGKKVFNQTPFESVMGRLRKEW